MAQYSLYCADVAFHSLTTVKLVCWLCSELRCSW